MMKLSDVSAILLKMDNIEILTHHYPDGDTLGSAYALCLGLQSLGKSARVILAGKPADKFNYLLNGVKQQDFKADNIVSVDVAANSMLGENEDKYTGRINLCIDHHISNSVTADERYVDGEAAAAAEIIFALLKEMKVNFTKEIADCLYTGISTDTGCFMYTNTTPETHKIAAELMEIGCDFEQINKAMFETKSRAKLRLERMVYDTLEFFCNGKCAVIYTTLEMQSKLGLGDDETEGLASIPRQIEGVLIGITMREKQGGTFKISVRTNGETDACEFCKRFGGGGHRAASGCAVDGSLDEVRSRLVAAAEEVLK